MKNTTRALILLFVLIVSSAGLAHAQSGSAYFGLGVATDTSNGQAIDTFGIGVPFATPKMTGLFGMFGGDFMVKPTIGVGAEASLRFSQANYAGLNYRPTFFDVNAVWRPLPELKRVVPEFQGGLGIARLSFYINQQACDIFVGCSHANTFIESSTHFQGHFSGGVRFYVTPSVFVRPQVDVHLVRNFFQFGRDVVPEYTIAIGYTFGR